MRGQPRVRRSGTRLEEQPAVPGLYRNYDCGRDSSAFSRRSTRAFALDWTSMN